MNTFKDNLLSVGLTEDEIIIYLATLQPDNDTVLKLSQTTGIPRTTVYLVIESLIEKGFIAEMSEGKKKRYNPASPQKIIKAISAKKDLFARVITDLQNNTNAIQALYNYRYEKPRLEYYEGIAEIRQLLMTTVGNEEVCLHLMSEEAGDALSDMFDSYRNLIKENLLATREIVSDSLTDKQYMRKDSTARNQIRSLPSVYRSNVDYILYDDGIIFITCKNKVPMVVHIRDKNMVQFEKIRFNFLWDHPLLQEDNK